MRARLKFVNTNFLYFFCFLFLSWEMSPVWADDSLFSQWKKINNSFHKKELIELLHCHISQNFMQNDCPLEDKFPPFQGLGIFVTFLKKNQVRGCYGAFEHRSISLRENLEIYSKGAMLEDPRYPAIQKSEWPELDWKVTIAASPIRVRTVEEITNKRKGIYLVAESGQNFVFVPGEIKTKEELKAIVRKYKIQEIYSFEAVVFSSIGKKYQP